MKKLTAEQRKRIMDDVIEPFPGATTNWDGISEALDHITAEDVCPDSRLDCTCNGPHYDDNTAEDKGRHRFTCKCRDCLGLPKLNTAEDEAIIALRKIDEWLDAHFTDIRDCPDIRELKAWLQEDK